MSLELIVTDAGRAALINAANTGLMPVTIAQIGLSSTATTPTSATAALTGEFKRIAAIGGGATADDAIHVSLRDDSADEYTLRSFALYLSDGTLFATYGQAGAILNKTSASTALVALDVVFADISAAELVIGATNFTDPDATTTRKGLVRLATTLEAKAGTEPNAVVTPGTLAAAILDLLLARDGSGSGIDADLLDGQHGAYYANVIARLGYTPVDAAGDTMTGPLILVGDPTGNNHAARKAYVDGLVAASALMAKILTVDGSGSGLDADLLDGQHASAFLLQSAFTGASILAKLLGVDGTGSGLDADLLDGRHAGDFLLASTYTAANILAKLATVDGAGSGLDADLLDGRQATDFLLQSGFTGAAVLAKLLSADGSGSGLDADLLDGRHAGDFLLATDATKFGSNANGYWEKRANGVIEQWGRTIGSFGEGNNTRTFPIAFTDAASVNVQVIPINATGATGTSNDVFCQARSNTLTTFTFMMQATDSGSSIGGFTWRAVGI